jgi:hypothetical protein
VSTGVAVQGVASNTLTRIRSSGCVEKVDTMGTVSNNPAGAVCSQAGRTAVALVGITAADALMGMGATSALAGKNSHPGTGTTVEGKSGSVVDRKV